MSTDAQVVKDIARLSELVDEALCEAGIIADQSRNIGRDGVVESMTTTILLLKNVRIAVDNALRSC